MTIYVVCEDYTTAFIGLFKTQKDAEAKAQEIGGYIIEYEEKD